MDAIKELLDRQGGIARRRDLLAAGLSRRQLARRVERGELRALTPQLFTDRQEPTADEPLRAVAINLNAVVGHTSAGRAGTRPGRPGAGARGRLAGSAVLLGRRGVAP
ncbi:MAG: type IV toxin-antitoxin system AbiEi family antitoxin domain-containing protein [Frankiales bacterium]|nr:type IV toxin-antitoxin system AbiEi family antitoxin domain-containing protein [Frankiales bacterium]